MMYKKSVQNRKNYSLVKLSENDMIILSLNRNFPGNAREK
jgi:hypothetical protein